MFQTLLSQSRRVLHGFAVAAVFAGFPILAQAGVVTSGAELLGGPIGIYASDPLFASSSIGPISGMQATATADMTAGTLRASASDGAEFGGSQASSTATIFETIHILGQIDAPLAVTITAGVGGFIGDGQFSRAYFSLAGGGTLGSTPGINYLWTNEASYCGGEGCFTGAAGVVNAVASITTIIDDLHRDT